MTLAELKDILAATGLPVTYRMWPVGSAPPLPFICYRVLESRNFAADGEVYQRILQAHGIEAELGEA